MSSDSILDRIQEEAQRALLKNAIFRLESALMVGGTILAAVFLPNVIPWMPWFVWPVLGLVGEVAVIASSLTDKAEQQKVIESLFRERYNFNGIRDRGLREKLNEAEQYRQRIQQVVEQQKSGILRDRLKQTTTQVYDWIANMVTLARRIDTYRSDMIIQRDLKTVPEEIGRLTATLESNRQQRDSLQELGGRMARADLQLDHSLASLGTVYSQLLLIGSKDVDSDRAEQLHNDIRDQVLALQDITESLNEVYTMTGKGDTLEAAAAAIRRQQQAGRAGG
jgi:hypothetical protein